MNDGATNVDNRVHSPQVQAWIRQIRREQAAGFDLDAAAEEVRQSFEDQQGAPLDVQQAENWRAAKGYIAKTLDQKVEYLGNLSLRKPRRPDWYPGPKASDANWPPLRAFFSERKKWKEQVVDKIDSASTEVVSLFENPAQTDFRGRGLVVGYVQSGKTVNMTSVMAKAVDAGYKFVIVLAGLTNSLRKQTQGRLEDDLRERNPYGWHLHTTREDNGDFLTPPNQWFAVMTQAQLVVLKKNVAPLGRLIKTIGKTPTAHRARMPVLIIDDECDQAGVNATGSQYQMTAINEKIRTLLSLLPRVQYVGYTATPFANILINPEKPQGGLDDLYPEDFITALPRPEGYFGPDALFGAPPTDADQETEDEAGLNMIRKVPDNEVAQLRPPSAKARKTFEPSIPPTLDKALRYFVLATACRYHRGQDDKHSSMLIHSTVYTDTHDRLSVEIEEWVRDFSSRWKNRFRSDLKELWDEEAKKVDAMRFGRRKEGFAEIAKHVDAVLKDIEVKVENSFSESRLKFDEGPKKYIVVGGSVLARGLTIEGLMVSHFVRSANQYDTLLQMGRWFGFRDGYEDLPRIWTTDDLSEAFRDLSVVEREIREDIDEYRKRDVTPAEFAVRIRQIPGLAITAAKKMVAAEDCDVSFSGEHLQTIRFQHRDRDLIRKNWRAGATLIDTALKETSAEPTEVGRLLRGVSLEAALTFLKSYSASDKDRFSKNLIEYIEAETKRADRPFSRWNVGIVEPRDRSKSGEPLGRIGKVALNTRSRLDMPRKDGAADIKALMSRRDVLMDVEAKLGDADWAAAKAKRQELIGDKTPLLLLYGISKESKPSSKSTARLPLDAVADILGVGLVLPNRGERRSFVRVRLANREDAEDILIDEPAQATT